MAGWGNDYIPSSRPVVAVPVRPKSSRLRHGSDATAFITQPAQAVMLDENIQYLTPNAAQFQQKVQRASSVSGPRPTQIIIRNDNGASNSQSNEDRPRSAHGHRRRPSSTHYHYEGERIRSSSRQRRRYDDYYDDEDDYYESDEYDRRGGGRRVRIIEERRVRGHSRSRRRHSSSGRSSGSSKERKQHKRSAEDEAMIKQLEAYQKREDDAKAKKKYEDELLMKQLKEAQEKEERDKADKKVAAKAIEDFKLKQAEEEEKREKERKEEEEKMVNMLMAGTPGLTERDARKFIRRAERNKDRAAHGELDEDDDRNSGVSSGVGLAGVVLGGGNALTTVSKQQQRPTYIKVHMKHLSPETLDVYSIPWEWDPTDTNYIIIKQWINESQQEVLFEHTRRQKERQRLTYPRDKLRADANQIVILKDKKERKKSPIKKTSWFFT